MLNSISVGEGRREPVLEVFRSCRGFRGLAGAVTCGWSVRLAVECFGLGGFGPRALVLDKDEDDDGIINGFLGFSYDLGFIVGLQVLCGDFLVLTFSRLMMRG